MVEYPLKYEDCFGTEESLCQSDGRSLAFTLRGKSFRGSDFRFLEIDGISFADRVATLAALDGVFPTDEFGDIYGAFTLQIPVPVFSKDEISKGLLTLVFDYRDNGNACHRTTFIFRGEEYAAVKMGYCAELMLIEIQTLLPKDCFLQCCLSCRYSHYNPYGNSDFGQLRCFKDWSGLAGVCDKMLLIHEWEASDKQGKSFDIQETWHCDAFELIDNEQWAYKDWQHYVYRQESRPNS